MANAMPNRLTYSWIANAAGAPGHKRAILLLMPMPRAMEIHRIVSETNAVARERYQYTLGLSPIREVARRGSQAGSSRMAASTPVRMASMIKRKDSNVIEDSSNSFSTGGVG